MSNQDLFSLSEPRVTNDVIIYKNVGDIRETPLNNFLTGTFIENDEYRPDVFFKYDQKALFSFDGDNYLELDCDVEELIDSIKIRRLMFRNSIKEKSEYIDHEVFWKYYKSFHDVDSRLNTFEEEVQRLLKKAEVKEHFIVSTLTDEELENRCLHFNEYCIKADSNYVLVAKDENKDWQIALAALDNYLYDFSQVDALIHQNESAGASFISLIDIPCAVINKNGNISLHNESFIKLEVLPSLLIELEGEGWLEAKGKVYKIITNEITDLEKIFVLIEQEEANSNVEGKSELGIISGSIAHELNNPIAGILAALTLLDFEEWDEENMALLGELKESILRCKGLVETFLGFSKYRGGAPVIKRLAIVTEQAISLLRYRMVESGVTIKLNIQEDVGASSVRASVLPMVFYLIFNELITILSHQLLIDPKLSKTIEIDILNNDLELSFNFKNLNLTSKDKAELEKKLIVHLLEMEGISYSVEGNRVVLNGAIEG